MKSALITGASGGIGRAFAVKLCSQGYHVTGVARSESKLKEFKQSLGDHFNYIVADLSTPTGQESISQLISQSHFDLLINNAGVGTVGGFTDISSEKQIAMLRLNVEALVRFSYAFLKTAKSGDSLINISSALAFMPTPGMGLYSATKALVTSFSESLWYEYKSKGIYVMGLCPGITETNFQVAAGGKLEDLPKGLSQTPETVVDVALAALKSRCKPTVLTGFKNLLFAGMSRLLPRKNLVNMNGSIMTPPPH
jgi:short-subunit dehydrogenase